MPDTKPITTENVEDEAGKTDTKPVEKASDKPVTPEAPYPSQADLDAIKEGKKSVNNVRKSRDMKAVGGASEYKTR